MIITLTTIYGMLISRLHGGGFIKGVPKVIRNMLWALPFGIVAALAVFPFTDVILYKSLAPVIVFALCYLGKTTGHGNWMDLGKQPEGEDEALEFIIKPLKDKIPRYWYDVIGLSLVGFAAVAGLVLVLAVTNPLYAVALAAGGLLKPVGYMVGLAVLGENGKYTVVGELGAGLFAFVVIGKYIEGVIWL